ncbi:MAG: YcxB family protein [Planctomycetes bacterium]|nr:YcxB family protein [Planctomycetota bacterium]
MKVSFELTMDDWIAFNTYYLYNSKEVRRTKTCVQLFAPALVLMLLMYSFVNDEMTVIPTVLLLLYAVAWFVFYPKRFYKNAIRKTMRIMKEGDNSGFLGAHEISFNDEGFTCVEPESTQMYKWSAVKQTGENDDYIFLYVTAVSAVILPKEKFFSDLCDVKNILIKYIDVYQPQP